MNKNNRYIQFAIAFFMTPCLIALAPSQSTTAAGVEDVLRRYCENYLPGSTNARLRDWQPSESGDSCGEYCEFYPSGFTKIRLRDYRC